jgi:hypothetical protein
VADWDSTSYTSSAPHCLRHVHTNLHYPEDLNGEVHQDGQIWSRALWDNRQALGNVKADTIILQGSFDFPGTTCRTWRTGWSQPHSSYTAAPPPTPSTSPSPAARSSTYYPAARIPNCSGEYERCGQRQAG